MGRRQDIVREWGGMAVPGRVEMKRVDLEETWIWRRARQGGVDGRAQFLFRALYSIQ